MSPINNESISCITALVAVTLALLLVSAEASIRTTVIIDNDVDAVAENWGGRLGRCQDYVFGEAVRGGGNGAMIPGASRDEVLKMCCRQLRELMLVTETAGGGEGCNYCMGAFEEAMRQMMEDERRRLVLGEEDKRYAWEVAEELPGRCGDASLSRCHFSHRRSVASWF